MKRLLPEVQLGLVGVRDGGVLAAGGLPRGILLVAVVGLPDDPHDSYQQAADVESCVQSSHRYQEYQAGTPDHPEVHLVVVERPDVLTTEEHVLNDALDVGVTRSPPAERRSDGRDDQTEDCSSCSRRREDLVGPNEDRADSDPGNGTTPEETEGHFLEETLSSREETQHDECY